MAISDAKKRANNKWDASNMVVLGCKVRRTKAEAFKALCKEEGTTPNAVFTAALDAFMEEHGRAAAGDLEIAGAPKTTDVPTPPRGAGEKIS